MNTTYKMKKMLLKDISNTVDNLKNLGLTINDLSHFKLCLEYNKFSKDFIDDLKEMKHIKTALKTSDRIDKIRLYRDIIKREYIRYNYKYSTLDFIDSYQLIHYDNREQLKEVVRQIDLTSKDNYEKSMLDCIETLEEISRLLQKNTFFYGLITKLIGQMKELVYAFECRYFRKLQISFKDYIDGIEKYIKTLPEYEQNDKYDLYIHYRDLFFKSINLYDIQYINDKLYLRGDYLPHIKLYEVLNPIKHVNNEMYKDLKMYILDK